MKVCSAARAPTPCETERVLRIVVVFVQLAYCGSPRSVFNFYKRKNCARCTAATRR